MTANPNANPLEFTGERFVPDESDTEISLEHVHRYLMASALCDGLTVLDAACGAGYGTAILASRAAQAHGVDVEPEAVNYATGRYGSDKVSFHAASVTDLPFDAATFDVVVSFETLEHLHEQEQMLAEFRRVLKPGGLLIISTPDRPIYNASLAEPNAFHVKELDRGEFDMFLRARFANVAFYGQRIVFGSLTLPQRGADHLQAVRRGPEGFDVQDLYGASMYIIAVCSDADVGALACGVYEGAIPQNAMASLLGGIQDRDNTIRTFSARAADAEQQIIQLNQRWREVTAQLDHARRVSEARRRAANAFVGGAVRRKAAALDLKLALNDLLIAAKHARLHPVQTLRLFQDIRGVRSSGLLDSEYYAPQKAQTALPALEDARHYVLVGRELDPNSLFSGGSYLELNPDVRGRKIAPLAHYIKVGHTEGRLFDPPAPPQSAG